MRIFTMIEINKSRPSDRIVRWSRQEVPRSIKTKVHGGKKCGIKYQKVGPNTNLIFFKYLPLING